MDDPLSKVLPLNPKPDGYLHANFRFDFSLSVG